MHYTSARALLFGICADYVRTLSLNNYVKLIANE